MSETRIPSWPLVACCVLLAAWLAATSLADATARPVRAVAGRRTGRHVTGRGATA